MVKIKIKVAKTGQKVSPGSNLTVNSENIVDRRYEKLRLNAISVVESQLNRCVFEDIHAESVNLGDGIIQSRYEDCVFTNCNFIFGTVGNVRLINCRFKRCSLLNLVGGTLEMIGCTFEDTRIERAVFHATSPRLAFYSPVRSDNEFYDNDFSSAELLDVDFRGGIDLYSQRLPSGESYIFVADTCKAAELAGKLQIDNLHPGESARLKSTVSLLKFYCSSGQKHQLLATRSMGGLAKHLRGVLQ